MLLVLLHTVSHVIHWYIMPCDIVEDHHLMVHTVMCDKMVKVLLDLLVDNL